jgi:hypothetical protein
VYKVVDKKNIPSSPHGTAGGGLLNNNGCGMNNSGIHIGDDLKSSPSADYFAQGGA